MASAPEKPDIEKVLRQKSVVDEAFREAARGAVQMHRRLGNRVPVLRDGRVIEVSADEIVLSTDVGRSDQSRNGG